MRELRRRVVLLNRMEDLSPGRVAFVVYRSRAQTQRRALRGNLVLARWLEARRQQILAEQESAGRADAESTEPQPTDSHGADVGTSATSEGVPSRADDGLGPAERPSESWTKGRLYELAREYEIDGRSKLNKADLLDVVRREFDVRH